MALKIGYTRTMPALSLRPSFWMLLPGGERRLKDQARVACEEGNLEGLQRCLRRGLPIDSVLSVGRRRDRRVPLVVYAARQLFTDGLALLLDSGANPNQKATDADQGAEPWQDGQSALFSLTLPFNPTPPDAYIESPNEFKATLACARLLIRAGADVEDEAWNVNWRIDPPFKSEFDTYNAQSTWRSVRQQIDQMGGERGDAWKHLVRRETTVRRALQIDEALPPPTLSPSKPRF